MTPPPRPEAVDAEDAILAAEELKLLREIGFMACDMRHAVAAQAIFEGLRVLEPERPYPWIGLALARIAAGEPDEAARLLRQQALPAHPENLELRLFLGLALREAERDAESRRTLGELLAATLPDSPMRRVVSALLDDASSSSEMLRPQRRTPRLLH